MMVMIGIVAVMALGLAAWAQGRIDELTERVEYLERKRLESLTPPERRYEWPTVERATGGIAS